MGGPHPSVKADELLRISPFVDYAVRGEGESCFSQLVDALESKEPPDNIMGRSFKLNGRIQHNPVAKFIQDLNKIPYRAKELRIIKSSYT